MSIASYVLCRDVACSKSLCTVRCKSACLLVQQLLASTHLLRPKIKGHVVKP